MRNLFLGAWGGSPEVTMVKTELGKGAETSEYGLVRQW